MITVESYAPGGRNADTREASQVVVRDAAGNVLAVVVAFDGNNYIVATENEPDFPAVLATLGLTPPKVGRRIDVRRTH